MKRQSFVDTEWERHEIEALRSRVHSVQSTKVRMAAMRRVVKDQSLRDRRMLAAIPFLFHFFFSFTRSSTNIKNLDREKKEVLREKLFACARHHNLIVSLREWRDSTGKKTKTTLSFSFFYCWPINTKIRDSCGQANKRRERGCLCRCASCSFTFHHI